MWCGTNVGITNRLIGQTRESKSGKSLFALRMVFSVTISWEKWIFI